MIQRAEDSLVGLAVALLYSSIDPEPVTACLEAVICSRTVTWSGGAVPVYVRGAGNGACLHHSPHMKAASRQFVRLCGGYIWVGRRSMLDRAS